MLHKALADYLRSVEQAVLRCPNVCVERYVEEILDFPKLPSFPHHKHLPDTVIDSNKPDISSVVEEAERAQARTGVGR